MRLCPLKARPLHNLHGRGIAPPILLTEEKFFGIIKRFKSFCVHRLLNNINCRKILPCTQSIINISIYTPVEGGVVTAEADREWITIKELTNERATIAVAPNPADTTRYGQITFSYNNEECIGLSVGQEGREGR